jgi:hypothetical protein
MAAKRLWYLPAASLAACLALAAMPARGNNDNDGLSAREAELLADFLILAIQPEGEEKDYKLVEIGDKKINAGLLGVVINALPLDFLGLGSSRDYDEAAEVAQCRAACKANARCADFTYVRPSDKQPVGVCHLKEKTSFGVMTPVVDAPGRSERPIRDPVPAIETAGGDTKIVFDDSDKTGRVHYAPDDARVTPVTLKFLAPIANAKVFIRAAEITGQRTWATVETFDVKGKPIERTGAWISVGAELNFGHAVAIGGETDRIATVKISAREAGALLVDGVEFVRTFVAPPPRIEKPAPAAPQEPAREVIPPPPELPPLVAENFPLPPRTTPTAPPTPLVPASPPVVSRQPPPESAAAPTAIVENAVPARSKRGLPLWLAIGAMAVMFGGAGLYWRNHRARSLKRLSTRLVSNGLDRLTIAIGEPDAADMSLRFVVRAHAGLTAPANRIDIIPNGAVA